MTQALLIDCHKIINWLEDRKKLPKDWYNYAKAAQEKIKLLTRDHQQYSQYSEIQQYVKKHMEKFHYVDVNKVVEEILKTKWAQDKSIVFGYSDKRVKEWVSLKKFMDGKLIGVINIAKFISQSLGFDLPSLNKNIELLDNQMSVLKRKIDFNINTIYQQQKESENQMIKMGMKQKGEKIQQQIPLIIAETPKLFNKVHEKLKSLHFCIQIYEKICKVNNNENQLEMVKYFYQNGDDFVENYNNRSEKVKEEIENTKYEEFYKWKPQNQWGIQIQGISGLSEGKKQNIQTILQNRSLRQKFIEELNQLVYFYRGVKYEMTLKSMDFQGQNAIKLAEGDVHKILAEIGQILSLINGHIVTRVQMKNNTKSYRLMIGKFKNYEKNIEYVKNKNKDYEIQIEQMKEKRQNLCVELRSLRAEVVECKNHCEKWLTTFIGKQIRITGDVNRLQ